MLNSQRFDKSVGMNGRAQPSILVNHSDAGFSPDSFPSSFVVGGRYERLV